MSTDEFLPFALPDIGEQEIQAVVSAMRSGWLSSGPEMVRFEADFAEFLGGDVHAVALNSATAGLHLALEALGIGPGDEVLVPTWTFTSTAEVVRYLGAEPVFVDVDPVTLNIDLAHAETLISSRTAAVMPVHFAGLPVATSAIAKFSATHGLAVVEDAAHAFPAQSEGVTVGAASSSATVFSFYATKTMTTGEGGMLVTPDAGVAQRARTMRLHGISRDAFDRYRSSAPSWRYEVVAPGHKYNLTDPAAAMGRVQLSRATAMRDRRAEIAGIYREALADTDLQLPAEAPDESGHAWHLFVIRLADGPQRDEFIAGMSALGVGTSVHFIPLHMQPYWRDRCQLENQDFPVASAEFGRVVSLPIFSSMTNAQVDRVLRSVMESVG